MVNPELNRLKPAVNVAEQMRALIADAIQPSPRSFLWSIGPSIT
jgi:hypothetical protein